MGTGGWRPAQGKSGRVTAEDFSCFPFLLHQLSVLPGNLAEFPAWEPHHLSIGEERGVLPAGPPCAAAPPASRQPQSTSSYLFSLSLGKVNKTPKPLQSQLASRSEAETPNRNIATNQIIYRLKRKKWKYIRIDCSFFLVSIFLPFCFGTRYSQHVTVRSGYL